MERSTLRVNTNPNLPVNGSDKLVFPSPNIWPFVLSIINFATWSKNMGFKSFFCKKLYAVNQGSSLMLYGNL